MKLRVVHISAIGARRDGPSVFSRTKAEADAHLQGLAIDWAILRPGLVLAPAVYGGTAMLRGIAGLPGITPLVGADARIQVVSIDAVADTVAFCLEPEVPLRVVWEIAHPQILTLADIVTALRLWLGFAPQPLWRLPDVAGGVVAKLADALGWLGWRSPARSTAMAQLTAGVVGDPAPWMAATGIRPQSLAEMLAARPSSVQDRWFARLYLVKPLAITALALFWIATGAIALGPGRAAAMSYLTAGGFSPALATPILVLGSLLDIGLGLMLCVRKTARAALLTMLAITSIYLVAGTLTAPHLWLDPLGAFTKVIPMLVATALTLAILDER